MTSKLEQILTRCLNGRRIAVWGTPTRALLRELIPYSWESADRIDPRTHYVIPVTQSDCDDFLADAQSENYEDVSDFITYDDPGKNCLSNGNCTEPKSENTLISVPKSLTHAKTATSIGSEITLPSTLPRQFMWIINRI